MFDRICATHRRPAKYLHLGVAIALILGAPEKALIVMAWWELMTVVIDIPQAARMLILRQKPR